MKKKWGLIAILFSLVLVLSACGSQKVVTTTLPKLKQSLWR